MIKTLVIAFLLTLLFTFLLKWTAPKIGLIDIPSDRKQHKGEIPIIGGIAMFLSLAISSLFLKHPPQAFTTFLLCTFVLVLCGALDDRFELSPKTRFMVQGCTTTAMILIGNIYIDQLGDLFTSHNIVLTHGCAYLFTIFCVVGVTNAVNMIDGIDGLAGGISLGAMLWLMVVALLAGMTPEATALSLIAATIIGFLVFNMQHPWRKKAAVFMGDAGSTMLGFAFCWFAIDMTQIKNTSPVSPITVVWIIGLPILDTVVVMSNRMIRGKSPFMPSRDHLHHLLLSMGLSESYVTLSMITLSIYFGLVGVFGWLYKIPDYYLCYGFIGTAAVYALAIAWLKERQRGEQKAGTLTAVKLTATDEELQ